MTELYNLSNFSESSDPSIWLKTANNLSEGALVTSLIISIYLIIMISVSYSTRDPRNGFNAANYITTVLGMILWLMGALNGLILFVLILLTGISVVMLIYDRW